MADNLKDLLDALDESRMEDRFGELDMTKVARAFRHVLSACFALELAVYGAKERVVEATIARFRAGLVHRLGINDMCHAHGLDLLGRQESELDLLDDPQGRVGVRKIQIRHFDDAGLNR